MMNDVTAADTSPPSPDSNSGSGAPAVPAVPAVPAAPAGPAGDAPHGAHHGPRPGTARAALASPPFRRIYAGSVASNVGTWMQNVVLTAYAYQLTQSATFVAIVGFAQLGPLLLTSPFGGWLADRFDRKKLLIWLSIEQAVFAFGLAAVARDAHPPEWEIVALVFAIGIGGSLAAPIFAAVLPALVPTRDIPGAVSLNSANLNLSRMVGALIGPLMYAAWGVSWVFAANAVTYFFIVIAVATVAIPPAEPRAAGDEGVKALLGGFRIARSDVVIRRVLVTLVVFSLACLIFVVQMPTLAEQNLGLDAQSGLYGLLYSTFALGGAIGALSIGTVLAGRDLTRIVQVSCIGFAAALTAFAFVRVVWLAFPIAFVVGVFYFALITALSTVLQSRLTNANRGRVTALWIMGFGGMVPIGNLIAGPFVQRYGITPVLCVGAVVALGLAFYANLRGEPVEEVSESIA